MRMTKMLILTLTLLATAAHAQDAGSLNDRLDRLERDLTFVQKQVYRNGGSASTDSSGAPAAPATTGQMQVRLAQIEEEIRQIRGLIEQSQFQNKQTANELKKFSDDVDYRLRAIEQKQAAAAVAPAPVAAATPEPEPVEAEPKPANYKPEAKEKEAAAETKTKEEKPKEEKPALTGKDFPNSNAHYSYAFKLLNDKKYSEAGASFDAFVKKYPTDPLTSNAFYWLGESQFARNDFTRSADSFRKGFESAPEGQKAPDNLYKLAMSLSQIKRTNEACIVLNQVATKYADSAARTAAKAKEARTTLQCK